MKTKKLILTLVLGLGLGGGLTTLNAPVSAAAKANPQFKTYQTIPKVMRGTWRTANKKMTYKFYKKSYTIIDARKKPVTTKFTPKEFENVSYSYARKTYEIYARVTKQNVGYAGYNEYHPMTRHGKKVLRLTLPANATTYRYLYKVK
ncbi:hypothetical protein [Levilactobacillus acidifarinae]|uniref:Uncharacterized protein n=1 Tax=Levilactobacillus acidifarinae DSM 19394 = JCM 15949 TaxID=1423715 RepID=A0A0R1LP68_9LACO|nr:hypothetical protein [Levilactobacillus acidifarinae]KRK93994.1 hypothetical protein FD25_GL001323 [Levilactobacillus acidifarinae DSM 19394]GEO68881.1 hypothetical protein LAC03_07910 [Levilactobacillus acidifarinae]